MLVVLWLLFIVALVGLGCAAILWVVGNRQPAFGVGAEDTTWFVALKFKGAGQKAAPSLASGVRQTWAATAEFSFIGDVERYWDRFLLLSGPADEKMPIILSDDFADAYVVRLKVRLPPVMVLGAVRMLYLSGIWSMPKGEVSIDPKEIGSRPDAMPTKQSVAVLLSRPHAFKPTMVNFLKYRAEAKYDNALPDSAPISGRKAYGLYGLVAFQTVHRTGGRLIFFGRVETVLREAKGGLTAGAWDEIGVMQYSEPKAILTMEQVPAYRAALKHRDAGLERTVIIASSQGEAKDR